MEKKIRVLDKSKRCNKRCGSCQFWISFKDSTIANPKDYCSNPDSIHYNKLRDYWHMCKSFTWADNIVDKNEELTMNKLNKFLAKGLILFFVSKDDELFTIQFDRDYYGEYYKQYGEMGKIMLNDKYEREFTHDVYHLMSGKEFLECVKCGGFTDYDGHVAEVFIDGFKSNVGLITDNLVSGGEFFMDEDAWSKLCEDYDVKVNWVNK